MFFRAKTVDKAIANLTKAKDDLDCIAAKKSEDAERISAEIDRLEEEHQSRLQERDRARRIFSKIAEITE